jgi:hypothetical protein
MPRGLDRLQVLGIGQRSTRAARCGRHTSDSVFLDCRRRPWVEGRVSRVKRRLYFASCKLIPLEKRALPAPDDVVFFTHFRSNSAPRGRARFVFAYSRIAQTQHRERCRAGFVACIKQHYNVVWLCVGEGRIHVIRYFLRVIDRDGQQILAFTGCNLAQGVCLNRRA